MWSAQTVSERTSTKIALKGILGIVI